MILNINNGDHLTVTQERPDGPVKVIRESSAGTVSEDEPMRIPAGDMVMLLNYYRYVKDNDLYCEFVNPGGRRSASATVSHKAPGFGTWVDTEDRLPARGEDVVVAYGDSSVDLNRYKSNGKWSWCTESDPLAWMPLPKSSANDVRGWHLIQEGLPKVDGRYLVETSEGYMAGMDFYAFDGGWDFWENFRTEIVAWRLMPLPPVFEG